ncbi:hypothetical protein SAMN04489723_10679 [Algoriphagus aquimarinus]|uniref:6-bladed beta-propeller n=2 Tax=Algoriphagus aquimarinus TaxID=237018 RepID=A0A1I0ZHL4_9BACT|nr:hypothetical protein SAMN04489723_10679 [Algoriphagus aquimarinus]
MLGCSSKETQKKDTLFLNPTNATPSILLSEMVDSMEYIKLETSEESLMSRVGEIIIKNKYIYVRDYDQQIIFLFDKKGKYITKLDKKGEGPEEYSHLDKFRVDDKEEFIEILDFRGSKSRLLRFSNISFNLQEVNRFSVPTSNSWQKEKNSNTFYFSTQQIDNTINNEESNADIIVIKDFTNEVALFKKKIITNGSNFSPNTESLTTNEKGEIFASIMYSNTFFQLLNNRAHPILTVDFGKYQLDSSIRFKSTEEQMRYLNNTEDIATFPVLNINTSKIQAFSYYFKENGANKTHHYLNFSNNAIFHTRDIVNDLTNYPEKIYLSSYFWGINHEVLHGNYLVDIVLPAYTNEGKTIEINGVGPVEPEDNPIILLMKLKEEYTNN